MQIRFQAFNVRFKIGNVKSFLGLKIWKRFGYLMFSLYQTFFICWHYNSKGKAVNPLFLITTKFRIWYEILIWSVGLSQFFDLSTHNKELNSRLPDCILKISRFLFTSAFLILKKLNEFEAETGHFNFEGVKWSEWSLVCQNNWNWICVDQTERKLIYLNFRF